MRKRIGRLWREYTGRAGRDVALMLQAQVTAGREGTLVAVEVAQGAIDTVEARRRIADIEHVGDDARSRVVEQLGIALILPLDREDLFRVSRSIDDVLDNVRDFVRALDLWDAPGAGYVPMLHQILSTLALLEDAVASVEREPSALRARLLMAKKSCNDIRRTYDEQIGHLLQGATVDGPMLYQRELLRRLDVVGLRLGEAIDALADAAVKRAIA